MKKNMTSNITIIIKSFWIKNLYSYYFNREEFIEEKTEVFNRKDTTCSDEEYGPGEALAVEEFTEMKDKINVVDNTFGIYIKYCLNWIDLCLFY